MYSESLSTSGVKVEDVGEVVTLLPPSSVACGMAGFAVAREPTQ